MTDTATQTSAGAQAAGAFPTLRACPVCGPDLLPWAEIPSRYVREAFFTDELRALVPALSFGACPQCRSIWATDRRRDAELLNRIYTQLPYEYWTRFSCDARLYRHVDDLLHRFAPGRVLCDVGCGDGKLLQSVSERWEKHGIEPGRAAAKLCRAQGFIVTVGTPCTTIDETTYDAITCIDTLEHMRDPGAELAAMAAMLRPGGVLLIYTGDPAAWSARLAGRWWEYLHCVGHISVLSRRAITQLAARCGLSVIHRERLGHGAGASPAVWLRGYITNVYRGLRGCRYVRLPYCRDHQLFVARKN